MNPSVTRVTEILPPASSPRPRDWASVEEELGTPLPEDYKELVDLYGGGVFNETIWLLEPGCPVEDYDLLAVAREREEILTKLWSSSEQRPAELSAPGARLLPWAYAEEGGQYLYWLAEPGRAPEHWTVMVNEGRGPGWEAHPVSCARFLLSFMTGEIHSEILPEPSGEAHTFDSNTDILQ
jgi:hypothetical protein